MRAAMRGFSSKRTRINGFSCARKTALRAALAAFTGGGRVFAQSASDFLLADEALSFVRSCVCVFGIALVICVYLLFIHRKLFSYRKKKISRKKSDFAKGSAGDSSAKTGAMKKYGSIRFRTSVCAAVISIVVTLLVSSALGAAYARAQKRLIFANLRLSVQLALESAANALSSRTIDSDEALDAFAAAVLKDARIRSLAIDGYSSGGGVPDYTYVWISDEGGAAARLGESALSAGSADLLAAARNLAKTKTAEIQRALSGDSAGNGGGAGDFVDSVPYYDAARAVLYDSYVFFRPLAQIGGGYRAVLYAEVVTKPVIAVLRAGYALLILAIICAGVCACAASLILWQAAFSRILVPLQRLMAYTSAVYSKKIPPREKDFLADTYDEINELGSIINDMLRKISIDAGFYDSLKRGSEIQRMFMPLSCGPNGEIKPFGEFSDKRFRVFCYYMGSKILSGDYFDYIKIDERYCVIIKCDVSGDNVDAALVMAKVSALFINYFKNWSSRPDKLRIDHVASQINDVLVYREYDNRFVALNICLFDFIDGQAYFCNAGDSIIHIYDAGEKKMKSVSLPESPAAGVYPSSMLTAAGGYSVVRHTLKRGDVLFLYTDGIEESKRMFRDDNYEVTRCFESVVDNQPTHGNHAFGQNSEDFGRERVYAVIEAVFAKESYILKKYHAPKGEDTFEFDFSSCEGNVNDAVLALIAVEKVFRMYKRPKALETDRVFVEEEIDLFLKKHFIRYNEYCSFQSRFDDVSGYVCYSFVNEEPQRDDLTLMGVQKI